MGASSHPAQFVARGDYEGPFRNPSSASNAFDEHHGSSSAEGSGGADGSLEGLSRDIVDAVGEGPDDEGGRAGESTTAAGERHRDPARRLHVPTSKPARLC